MRGYFGLAPMLFTFIIPAMTMRLSPRRRAAAPSSCSSPCRCATGRWWSASSWPRWALLAVLLALTLVYAISSRPSGRSTRARPTAATSASCSWAAAYVAIGVMASSFTRNQIVAFILAFAISFALYLFGRMSQIVPPALQPIIVVPQHRQPLREHQPRRHRHPRRPLLPVGDRRLPGDRHRLPRIAEVEVEAMSHGQARRSAPTPRTRSLYGAVHHRRHRRRQPARHARLRPHRPHRERRLHAVAVVQGPGQEAARLHDGQGVHLEGPAARAQDGQPLRARPGRRIPDQLQRQVPLGGHRPGHRQEARGRGQPLQGAEAADPGAAQPEVRGGRLLPGPLPPVRQRDRVDPPGGAAPRAWSTRCRRSSRS